MLKSLISLEILNDLVQAPALKITQTCSEFTEFGILMHIDNKAKDNV